MLLAVVGGKHANDAMEAAWLGDGYKDLAQMADCNQQLPGFQSCGGKNVALRADIRFRARF